jgi:hypothetical protein
MQLPIAGLSYEKMDGSVGTLQRHWFHNQTEPIMSTYKSQLYPRYEGKKELFVTTEVPVLRFYAPLTTAKGTTFFQKTDTLYVVDVIKNQSIKNQKNIFMSSE